MTSAATAFGAKTTAQEVVKRFTAHVSGRTFLITVSLLNPTPREHQHDL